MTRRRTRPWDRFEGYDGPTAAPQIVTWRSLTLHLVRDRCEGGHAWDRMQHRLTSAGLRSVVSWRGYV